MDTASPHFDDYRGTYPARLPDLTAQRFADEVTNVTKTSDVVQLACAPASDVILGLPQQPEHDASKYLWLVTPDSVVIALEYGGVGVSLSRGRLAHTNLSGGELAHAGGELWFQDHSVIWINGSSRRYRPRSEDELTELVTAFARSRYDVRSAGWDAEVGQPARVFRGVT